MIKVGPIQKIVLRDCYYPSFFLIFDLISRGVDGVFPALTNRNYDFRKGELLGQKDHIVYWKKPTKPEWMDKDTYDTYPSQIRVREFKVSGRIYVTTLLNDKKYHKKGLAELYEFRWQIELNIRNIKTTMNMDMLSCKTPEMVKKEIGIHFLGYNFIRILIAEACVKYNVIPLQVSFKGAIQLLNQFMPFFNHGNTKINKGLYDKLLWLITKNKVGNRPGRLEPRAIKSEKRKSFPTLKNRAIEKEKLNRQREKRILKYAA